MKIISEILGSQYRGEIDQDEAGERLAIACTPLELADFIVDAKNRGWISNFNIGMDDEGKLL